MEDQAANPRLIGTDFASAGSRNATASKLLSWIGISVVIIYVSSAYSFIYRPELLFKPLYWHVLIVGLAVIAILVRSDEVAHKFPRPFLAWIGIYLGQLLIAYLYSSQTEGTLEHFVDGLLTAALLFSFTVLLLVITPPRQVIKTLLIVTLFSVFVNYIDFFVPSLLDDAGRAAGWYENPNTAGYVITLSMILSCLAVPRKYRLAFCVFVGIGILLTFSRSAWILWAIGIIGLSLTDKLFVRTRLASVLAISSLSVLIIYALWSGAMLDVFDATGYDVYLDDNTAARLSGSRSISQDGSINTRIELVRENMLEFQKHPWFGSGLGATSEGLSIYRPHNLYLTVAVEGGIFGLLVLFALIGILWTNVDSVGRVAVVVYAVSCLFSHNNLQQGHLLCLLTIMIVVYRRPERQRSLFGLSAPNAANLA